MGDYQFDATESFDYCVDVVFVVDVTGSMGPILGEAKVHMLNLHEQLLKSLAAKGKYVSELRVRIIAFRDFVDYPESALYYSSFLSMPGQQAELHEWVNSLHPMHGGVEIPGQPEPESGLEGLGVAITSDWTRRGTRRRHIICLFSDTSAYSLEQTASHMSSARRKDRKRWAERYPEYLHVAGSNPKLRLPRSWRELTNLWSFAPPHGAMEPESKRLLLFTPALTPWYEISNVWDNVIHYPVDYGQGLQGVPFAQILNVVAQSV